MLLKGIAWIGGTLHRREIWDGRESTLFLHLPLSTHTHTLTGCTPMHTHTHTYTLTSRTTAAGWLTRRLGGGWYFQEQCVVHVIFPSPSVNSRDTAVKKSHLPLQVKYTRSRPRSHLVFCCLLYRNNEIKAGSWVAVHTPKRKCIYCNNQNAAFRICRWNIFFYITAVAQNEKIMFIEEHININSEIVNTGQV